MTTRWWRLRCLGAAVAAALSTSIAAVGFADIDGRPLIALGGTIGVPVGAVMGWRGAPSIRSAPGDVAFDRVLRMSAVAVLLGALLVTVAMVGGGLGEVSDLGAMFGLMAAAVAILLLGLVVFGVPAYIVAFVVLWPWSLIIRHTPTWMVGSGDAA